MNQMELRRRRRKQVLQARHDLALKQIDAIADKCAAVEIKPQPEPKPKRKRAKKTLTVSARKEDKK